MSAVFGAGCAINVIAVWAELPKCRGAEDSAFICVDTETSLPFGGANRPIRGVWHSRIWHHDRNHDTIFRLWQSA
ncbi:hypothetical protein N9Z87_00040 [Amylibacter sp.]|nr:hypothetical protein [Amylibacter sp.]